MSLIHDEVEVFPEKLGGSCPYRIRVWMETRRSPVVLVSQHMSDGYLGPPPNQMTLRVANYVYSAILGYSESYLDYFEFEHGGYPERGEVTRLSFGCIGHHQRFRLIKPVRQSRLWGMIEYFVKDPIER